VFTRGGTINRKCALSITAVEGHYRIFATDLEGHPSLVQFTPYSVPGEPDKGAYYIVQGLWPQLELKGEGGMVVRITRQTGQPKPYTEAGDGR
jgi:hypothetical protein